MNGKILCAVPPEKSHIPGIGYQIHQHFIDMLAIPLWYKEAVASQFWADDVYEVIIESNGTHKLSPYLQQLSLMVTYLLGDEEVSFKNKNLNIRVCQLPTRCSFAGIELFEGELHGQMDVWLRIKFSDQIGKEDAFLYKLT